MTNKTRYNEAGMIKKWNIYSFKNAQTKCEILKIPSQTKININPGIEYFYAS